MPKEKEAVKENKIMEIKELENQLETLKNNVAELENKIAEIKRNEDKKNKIPDVKDIPQIYDFDEYKKTAECGLRVWFVDNGGELICTDMCKESIKGNMAFPTKKFAEMFREKAQLIADCLSFKWYYDREFVPTWSRADKKNWGVYYDTFCKRYSVFNSSFYDENQVYFSSEEIAQKCAEWLNYKYFEFYNSKEDENDV